LEVLLVSRVSSSSLPLQALPVPSRRQAYLVVQQTNNSLRLVVVYLEIRRQINLRLETLYSETPPTNSSSLLQVEVPHRSSNLLRVETSLVRHRSNSNLRQVEIFLVQCHNNNSLPQVQTFLAQHHSSSNSLLQVQISLAQRHNSSSSSLPQVQTSLVQRHNNNSLPQVQISLVRHHSNSNLPQVQTFLAQHHNNSLPQVQISLVRHHNNSNPLQVGVPLVPHNSNSSLLQVEVSLEILPLPQTRQVQRPSLEIQVMEPRVLGTRFSKRSLLSQIAR